MHLALAKLRLVLHRPAFASQCPRLKLQNHKRAFGGIKLAFEAEDSGGSEAKAMLIVRMPEDDYRLVAESPALLNPDSNQSRADAPFLMGRQDCHRS